MAVEKLLECERIPSSVKQTESIPEFSRLNRVIFLYLYNCLSLIKTLRDPNFLKKRLKLPRTIIYFSFFTAA